MPFLVAVQLVWDSSELSNLQKKNMTLQINDKSVLKNMVCLQTSPLPTPYLSKVFKIYYIWEPRNIRAERFPNV